MGLFQNIANIFKTKSAPEAIDKKASLGTSGHAHDSSVISKRGMMDWLPSLHSAQSELTDDERELVSSRAYDVYRNYDLARAAVQRAKIGVVSCGLNPSPSLDGDFLEHSDSEVDDIENAIEREFGFAARTCDAEGMLHFNDLQGVHYLTGLLCGEGLASILFRRRRHDIYSIKLQGIDPARLLNPQRGQDTKFLKKGVQIDSFGAPIAYHILKAHPADFLTNPEDVFEWQKIDVYGRTHGRRKFLHLIEKERYTQTRGISFLSSVLSSLKSLKRYNESELIATILDSFMTFFLKDESEIQDSPLPIIGEDPRDPKKRDTVEISPGAIVPLSPGQSIEPWQPKRPNSQYDKFVGSISRNIAAALNIPLEEVILRFESSFSAARAAMLRAFSFYQCQRQLLENQYCQPFYSLWFDEAVAMGNIPHIKNYSDPRRRLAYQDCKWIGSARGAIDEMDEVNSAKERVSAGFSSIQKEAMQISGMSVRQIARENKKAERILGFGVQEIRSQRNVSVIEDENPKKSPIKKEREDE